MKLVILWTDALVYLLLLSLTLFSYKLIRNQDMRGNWRKVYATPMRMIAIVILAFYILIGLLDCIHYREQLPAAPNGEIVYADSIKSALDWLMLPNSEQMETSYSAPFATELFTHEMVKTPEGEFTWVKVKLQYVTGAKLLPLVLAGSIYALLVWLIITGALWLLFHRNLKKSSVSWHVGLFAFGLMVWLICVAAQLMQNYHILGTDKVGGDVFYAAIKSIRTGLVIGTLTTFITLPFAILFGATAGYFRGWIDDIIQYIYTTLSSVPAVLLIAAAVLTLDAMMQRNESAFELMSQRTDMRLLMLCCVLGITSWTSLCRIIRAETLKIRTHEYVLAAKVLGLRHLQIIYKHIIPNLMHLVLISIALDFSGLVLAEAVLSYVGVGVDPTTYSWGNMINGARMELGRDPIVWWSLMGAFVFMFGLVLSANIFADGVRAALDPRVS